MARPAIYLKAGADRPVRIQILKDGEPRDITGEVVTFRVAVTLDSGTPVLTKSDGDGIAVISAVGGLVDVVFYASDTLSDTFPLMSVWDMTVVDAAGGLEVLDFSTTDGSIPETYGVLIVERPLLVAG